MIFMAFDYYVLYKPFGIMCQFSPIDGKKTLADLELGVKNDVYPVGRLDEDSEGLIILTNDKKLTDQILNPIYQHNRTYLVQLEGDISLDAIKKLQNGEIIIKVKDNLHLTQSADVEKIIEPKFLPARNPPIRFRANIPTSWISLTIIEGKNRQVRKMSAAVGFPTLRLVRSSIEKLTIEGYQSGEIRTFSQKQIKESIFLQQR